MENPKAVYGKLPTMRVVCPDCGASGGNSGPCYCHECNYEVMMLPEIFSGRPCNWGEIVRQTDTLKARG